MRTNSSSPSLLRHLRAQTKNWSQWIASGLSLVQGGPVATLATSVGATASTRVGLWILPGIAGLRAATQALSGATTINYVPSVTAGKLTINQGEPFSLAAVINSTAHGSARSYTIGGNMPAGLTPQEGNVYNGVTLSISGTPTESGVFTVEIRGWEKTGGRGEKSPIYRLQLTVKSAVSPPAITTQPADGAANWGGSAQFSAVVSHATSVRWERDGAPLDDGSGVSGSHTATLTLSNLTSADDGARFTLRVDGEDGSVLRSRAAVLDVTSSAYALWREQQFSPATLFDEAVSGKSANPEGDARNNALEFALGSDPHAVDPADPFTRTIAVGNGQSELRLSFSVNPAADPGALRVESSPNLQPTWSAVPEAQIDRSQSDRWQVVVPLAEAPFYLRLRAQ